MANSRTDLFGESGFPSVNSRSSMCDVLRSLIVNNIEHFVEDRSLLGVRYANAFCQMLDNLNAVQPLADEVGKNAHLYDLNASTPGNGYRSQVAVVDSCVVHCIRVCRHVCVQRGSFLFRKEHCIKEVEAFTDIVGTLRSLMQLLKTLRSRSTPNSLFPEPGLSSTELLLEAENIDTTCFYGRSLGFQFCESMRKPMKFLAIMMASFSDAYYNTGGMVSRTASSLISCGKYAYSPEERAKRIVEVSMKASVDFCKAFWLLQEIELMQQVPGIVGPSLCMNKVIQIPAEPLQLPRVDGSLVDIPIPSSHLRPAPVICRLLSASFREGQLNEVESAKLQAKMMPPSPYLIIQCHGGGFVAQSSKSHEVYLREWAAQLDVPFLCIDYSLAPQAAYPRPLEECLYAYAWAVKNSHRLGSTGERICVVGDSAGGNLMMGVSLKAVTLGIRKPDGIYIMYTPLLIDFVPSPSRMLCIMDPLLPFGFMMRCLKAYAGQPTTDRSSQNEDDSDQLSDSIGPASDASSTNASQSSTPSHEPTELSPCQSPAMDYDVDSSKRTSPSLVAEEILVDLDDRPCPTNSTNNVPSALAKGASLIGTSKAPSVFMDGTTNSESFEEVTAADLLELQHTTTPGTSVDGSASATMSSVSLNSSSPSGSSPIATKSSVASNSLQPQPSEDYVKDFMDWYVLDNVDKRESKKGIESNTATSHRRADRAETEENVLFELPVKFPRSLTRRVTSMTSVVMNGISDVLPIRRKSQSVQTIVDGGSNQKKQNQPVTPASNAKKTKEADGIFANRQLSDGGSVGAVILEFEKFKVNSTDCYLSPFLAPDEVLRQLPKLGILSLHLDPCLDDSIMFGKRLQKLGNEIQLDILDSLPHGFLNFAMLSKDAHDGSMLCVRRLRELLNMPDTTT